MQSGAGLRLLLLHDTVSPQTERYWRIYANNIMDQLHVVVSEHDHIISAIRKGDIEDAEDAMIANWINGADRMVRGIATLGERGTW